MTKPATYLLRSTTEGVPYYLSNVSPNGCHIEFDRRIDHGWRFTDKERAELTRDHGHIRGRWVLLDREEKRRAAAQRTTGQEGGTA
jgi:hypothetical protein